MPTQRLRTLLTPRWFVLVLAVVVVVIVFMQLSQWQLSRHDERSAANAVIEENEDAEPVPAERLLSAEEPADSDDEWHPIRLTGTYDTEREVLVRYRPLEGEPGFHVLTPLVAADGTALLVDRGWIPQGPSATDLPDAPQPPSGEVRVTGRLRLSEDGPADQVRPETGQIRYINVPVIAEELPYAVYGGYAERIEQQPPASDDVRAAPPPEPDPGPHLSYAIQWVIFAIIAVGGVGFLAYDTINGGRLRERLNERELRRERRRPGTDRERTTGERRPAERTGTSSV